MDEVNMEVSRSWIGTNYSVENDMKQMETPWIGTRNAVDFLEKQFIGVSGWLGVSYMVYYLEKIFTGVMGGSDFIVDYGMVMDSKS